MKIIITSTFEKDFYNIFNSTKIIDFFIKKIKKNDLIFLSTIYKKFKIQILKQSIRWIIFTENNQQFYIPIFIVKKSDKKYWMNLILNKEMLDILEIKLQKNIDDFKSNKFNVY